MNAEFNWWLLIVGLVLGAALTWLVMAESTRRDADVTDSEQRGEALWIASTLTSAGRETESDRVEEILRLHREYLGAPPPDDPAEARAVARADLGPEPSDVAPRTDDGPSDDATALGDAGLGEAAAPLAEAGPAEVAPAPLEETSRDGSPVAPVAADAADSSLEEPAEDRV